MSKDIEEFFSEPSEGLLALYTKEQLWEIAQHYEITIGSPSKKTKSLLMQALIEGLVKKGIITGKPDGSEDDESLGGMEDVGGLSLQ